MKNIDLKLIVSAFLLGGFCSDQAMGSAPEELRSAKKVTFSDEVQVQEFEVVPGERTKDQGIQHRKMKESLTCEVEGLARYLSFVLSLHLRPSAAVNPDGSTAFDVQDDIADFVAERHALLEEKLAKLDSLPLENPRSILSAGSSYADFEKAYAQYVGATRLASEDFFFIPSDDDTVRSGDDDA